MKKKPAVPPGATELRRNPRPFMRSALIAITYLLGFIILDFITRQFQELPGIVAWYPPAGLTYALLLVFGVGFAPAVMIALFVSSLFIYRMPQPPYALFLWAFIISSIYGLATAFLSKRIRLDWQLRKLRDVIWFVFTAVFVSALLAVLSVLSSALTSAMPRSEVLRAIFNWWIGETVGVLTVTPFLLIYVMPALKRFVEGQTVRLPARRSFPPPTLPAIGQAASIALTLYLVFGAPALAEFHPLFLISLPLIWIALTRGFKGISVALLALNSGVVLALWLFRFDPAQLGELELLMIVNCIVGLLMGAAVTERKQAEEELTIVNKELLFQNEEKEKRAAELVIANKELLFQNEEKEKRAAELVVANKELLFQNEEKEKRAAELVVANKELLFQNEEKEKRAAELVIANKELHFQNEEKEKRAAELVIANKELHFQNEEKEKRAAELVVANKELLFQNEEKEKRAAELSIVVEKLKRNEELLRETGALAKVGGSEINPSDMTLNWTDEVFRIHELEPGRMPSVEEGLDYYAPEARPIIQEAVNNAIATGEGWSLELPLITAKGKHLWIRSIGKPEMKDGKTSRILGVFQDITERKQSEQALVHSHELLNLTGQMGKIGGWELDLETQTLNWTDEVYRIHEVDPATKLNVAEAINFYAPEARPVITAAVQAGRDSGSPWDLELPVITARGQHIWVRAQGAAERQDGKTVRLYGAFQEITERKRAEQALYESEKRFRALVENSSDAITMLDAKGIALYDSPAASGMLGYAPEDWIGLNVFALIHPDDLPEIRDLFQTLVETSGARVNSTFRVRHKSGSWLWIEVVTTNLLAEPAVKAMVLNYRDITERKQAEDALREREAKLSAIYSAAPVGIGVDVNRVIQEVNDTMCRITGYSREELIGQNSRFLIFTQEEDERVGREKYRLIAENRSEFIESRLKRKDGHIIDVLLNSVPLDDADLSQGITFTVLDITERKLAEVRIQRQLEHLTALSGIDRVISANFDLKLSLSEILNHVTKELGVDAADILILNPGLHMLEFAAERGFRTKAVRKTQIRLGESYAGRVALERQLIQISNLENEPDNIFLKTHLKDEDFVCYFGVPLIIKGQVKGVLEVFHRTALEPDAEWFDFLNTLAGQSAIAVEIATLFESLQHSNSDLFLAYDATIEGWSHALDLRDKETEGHTQRVTEMTVNLAHAFGLSEAELVQIRWGALLHDIGKMGVPDGILLKPEPLTDEEWVAMKKHPTFAYELLSPISYLRLALDIPYCHHEKWDGSGYPRGLKGDQIPLVARIFAVVDVWDALLSDRPYRAAWPEEKVLDHIRSLSGTHFDPEVVKISLESGLLKGQKRP